MTYPDNMGFEEVRPDGPKMKCQGGNRELLINIRIVIYGLLTFFLIMVIIAGIYRALLLRKKNNTIFRKWQVELPPLTYLTRTQAIWTTEIVI